MHMCIAVVEKINDLFFFLKFQLSLSAITLGIHVPIHVLKGGFYRLYPKLIKPLILIAEHA